MLDFKKSALLGVRASASHFDPGSEYLKRGILRSSLFCFCIFVWEEMHFVHKEKPYIISLSSIPNVWNTTTRLRLMAQMTRVKIAMMI